MVSILDIEYIHMLPSEDIGAPLRPGNILYWYMDPLGKRTGGIGNSLMPHRK